IVIDDHFVELGRRSTTATGAPAHIHKEMQVNFPLRAIFETVRARAEPVAAVAWASQSDLSPTEIGREEFEL
ncbi:MAG TPA: hypothetical protein VIP11_01295, partial [Gemmatimonadaceae bacterium]